MRRRLSALIARVAPLAVASLGACTMMPHYERPGSPVPASWPQDGDAALKSRESSASAAAQPPQSVSADQIGWHDFFLDARLRELIRIALENNRNLRIAVLNVAASEAQFRVERSNLFPSISATGAEILEKLPPNGALPLNAIGSSAGSTVIPSGPGSTTFRYFSATAGFTNYELDLFGRQRSLTTEAFEQYLAQYESRRSTQITLVSEVATDYFAVLADEALVKLTEETLKSETETYALTQAMYERDATTLLSVRQAESPVDAARASLAQYRRQLAEDRHALELVLGEEIPPALAPEPDIEQEQLLADLPVGLPSSLIENRPDILSAEHALRAANANIGAARAAFFPSIELTGSGGTASGRLRDLFSKGSGTWSFSPSITLPIFTGGQNKANLDLAHVDKKIQIATYEQTIQTAFREVADALSGRSTYRDQLQAQQALVAANADAYRLSELRFRQGVDSYLSTLDSERSLFAAQQTLVALRQAELANEVTLYKALGGGWRERSASTR
jgi:outer membrane protein, multidrug efflux system